MNKLNYLGTDIPKNPSEKDIDVKKLFNIIKKRIWLVIICIIICTFLGVTYSYKYTTPLFRSSATYLLDGATPDQISTYNVILTDPSILNKVIEELNLNTTPEALSGQISLTATSQVVTVTVTGSNPILNSRITNSLLEAFQEGVKSITGYTGVKILSEANTQPNMVPINAGHSKTIMTAFGIGIALGIGLVFFINSLDDTFSNDEEIELLLELPVLGSISKVRKIQKIKMKKNEKNLHLRGESYDTK